MRVRGRQGLIVTSLDEGTRSSRYHRNLIARLHGHQGVIVTSLLENLAVWMRLHGRQGIIVTSLDEGTSSSRSQGKQQKSAKNRNKGADNETGGNNDNKAEGAERRWCKNWHRGSNQFNACPRRYGPAALIVDASSTAVRQG